MWNGRFWVRRQSDPQPSPTQPPTTRPAQIELPGERRGPGLGGVVLAAVVGVVLGHLHFTIPGSGSLESTLTELMVVNQLWILLTYGSVVLILSVGRQGIDVLLLRSVVVGFILGVAFIGVTPLVIVPARTWLLVVFASGAIWAVLIGPVLALLALLANLVWYHSFRSLRPQLPIFNRSS
jgi:hypothetical protein